MRMYVKPNFPVLRHPVTGEPLPPDGAWVEADSFWLTRLRHGDVREAEPPADPAPHAPPSEPPAPAAKP